MEKWDIYDSNFNKTGRVAIRGQGLAKGDFHLVVFGITRHVDGRFLISRRAEHKPNGNTWEITGGSALIGETSIEAIKREIFEEMGVQVESEGRLLKRHREENNHSYFADIWYFEENINMNTVKCQEGEVTDIKLMTFDEISYLYEN